jgi:hypothetical protein
MRDPVTGRQSDGADRATQALLRRRPFRAEAAPERKENGSTERQDGSSRAQQRWRRSLPVIAANADSVTRVGRGARIRAPVRAVAIHTDKQNGQVTSSPTARRGATALGLLGPCPIGFLDWFGEGCPQRLGHLLMGPEAGERCWWQRPGR